MRNAAPSSTPTAFVLPPPDAPSGQEARDDAALSAKTPALFDDALLRDLFPDLIDEVLFAK